MNILSTMFNSVFNMTRLGVILFLVILIGRYMLSRFPKIYSYILWAALFIRLIIPINLNIHPTNRRDSPARPWRCRRGRGRRDRSYRGHIR